MTHLTSHPDKTSQPEVVINGVRMRLVDAPLACCALEVAAAIGAMGEPKSEGAVDLNVLLVSGTVTTKLAPAVLAMYEAMPEPRRVLAFGACAVAGGPYWDSYSVQNGASTEVPVNVFVPGCPPQPAALVEGLRTLTGGVA
jgi:NADH-quinone oxidoreductase subunit B